MISPYNVLFRRRPDVERHDKVLTLRPGANVSTKVRTNYSEFAVAVQDTCVAIDGRRPRERRFSLWLGLQRPYGFRSLPMIADHACRHLRVGYTVDTRLILWSSYQRHKSVWEEIEGIRIHQTELQWYFKLIPTCSYALELELPDVG